MEQQYQIAGALAYSPLNDCVVLVLSSLIPSLAPNCTHICVYVVELAATSESIPDTPKCRMHMVDNSDNSNYSAPSVRIGFDQIIIPIYNYTFHPLLPIHLHHMKSHYACKAKIVR